MGASLETLVRAGRADLVTADYVSFEIELEDDTDLLRLPDADLPSDWRNWPWPASTKAIGTFWHERRDSVALSVPSAVIPMHRNVLLNVRHPRFAHLSISEPTPFPIDTRRGVSSESNV